MKSVSYFEGRT